MMKKIIRLITYILCLVLLLGTVSACSKDGANTSGNNGGDDAFTITGFKSSIPETEHWLVRSGNSDYVIVLSDNPVNWEIQAANEMSLNIKKATGANVRILNESDVSEGQKMLVIGKTNLTAAKQITVPMATYGARGFIIKEIGGNVYILGGDTQGTLYGVYEFLHQQFGYEPYAIDEIFIETGVVEEKLLAFNMSEIPDIPYMQGVHEYYRFYNAAAGHRMRFNTYNEIFIGSDQPWHNVFRYLPKGTYNDPNKPATYHPNWFANDKELHYTAHGDLEELKLMQAEVLKNMKVMIEESFAEGKYYEYIGFMQNDHENAFPSSDDGRYVKNSDGKWVVADKSDEHVDSVKALESVYGKAYPAAMLIHFINPIQEELSKWVAEEYDGRKMSIMFFAYEQTELAPVDEVNAQYYPKDMITAEDSANPIFADDIYKDIYDGANDGKLRVHPDTTVFTAPIRTEFWREYDEDTCPAIVEKWKALTDKQSFWFYNFYFNSTTFMYYDVTYSMQSYFQAAKAVNAQYVFFESPMTKQGYYPFGNLNVYLFSKLGWDVNADVQQLVDDYFINYYKQAAGTMREFFDSVVAYYAYLKNYTGFTGVIGSGKENLTTDFWKEGILQGWISTINKAYKDIETLKYTDKELYDQLYERILYDSLWPRYLLMRFYAEDSFTDVSFLQELNQFKEDCARVGVKKAGSLVSDIKNIDLKR